MANGITKEEESKYLAELGRSPALSDVNKEIDKFLYLTMRHINNGGATANAGLMKDLLKIRMASEERNAESSLQEEEDAKLLAMFTNKSE